MQMADSIAYKIFNHTKETFLNEGFDVVNHNFFALESVPGSGKTTALIDYIAYFFSHGITKNEYQIYKLPNGNEKIIPAGEVNKWHLIKNFGLKEGEEQFSLKTKGGTDFIPLFKDKKVLITAFNSDIKKEIEKKLLRHPILRDFFKNGQVTVKTSHSLLFSLAKKLDIIPSIKNEEGEYISNNGIITDFSKGDFYLTDIVETLNCLKNKKPFDSFFKKTDNKKVFEFASLLHSFIKVYYNTDIVISNKNEFDLLFKKVDLKYGEDFSSIEELNKYFSFLNLNKKEEKEYFAKQMLVVFLKTFKNRIENGKIKVGHSFYYKEAFLEAINNIERLKELFSIDNNGKMLYDIVIVDEAQDLTPIMARLLSEYYKQNISEILIVGDPKQAIYAFSERINSFKVFKNILKNELKEFINPYTYRIPQKLCDYINKKCKEIDIYEKRTELISKNKDSEGIVVENNFNIEDIIKKALKENISTAVIGRTNAEILTEFIKVYHSLKQEKGNIKDYLKYIKINSKLKKDFKKLLTKGLMGIEDEKIKEKLQIITGKENPDFNDLLNSEEEFKNIPEFIIKFAKLLKEVPKKEIEEALNYRVSPKANIEFLTGHSSKGLEFENVVILSGITESAAKEDINEKFLYYVALTRTKKNIFVKNLKRNEKLLLEKNKNRELFDINPEKLVEINIPKQKIKAF